MYFIYKHIRLDTGETFYIGTGTICIDCSTYKQRYKRAYCKSGRSFLWYRITKITDYKVEVLEEFSNLVECKKEETGLIKKYGRVINGTGLLTNIVEGDAEIEEKRMEMLLKSIEKRKKKTYKYSLTGEFIEEYKSISDAARNVKSLPTDISLGVKGVKIVVAGFQWRDYKDDNIGSPKYRWKLKEVDQYNINGEFIKRWKSSKEAATSLDISKSGVRNCLSNISTSAGGFLWSYVDVPLDKKIDFKLIVSKKDGSLIGKYMSFSEAERELGICYNCISVYTRRGMPHPLYNFEIIKTKAYKEAKKQEK